MRHWHRLVPRKGTSAKLSVSSSSPLSLSSGTSLAAFVSAARNKIDCLTLASISPSYSTGATTSAATTSAFDDWYDWFLFFRFFFWSRLVFFILSRDDWLYLLVTVAFTFPDELLVRQSMFDYNTEVKLVDDLLMRPIELLCRKIKEVFLLKIDVDLPG